MGEQIAEFILMLLVLAGRGTVIGAGSLAAHAALKELPITQKVTEESKKVYEAIWKKDKRVGQAIDLVMDHPQDSQLIATAKDKIEQVAKDKSIAESIKELLTTLTSEQKNQSKESKVQKQTNIFGGTFQAPVDVGVIEEYIQHVDTYIEAKK